MLSAMSHGAGLPRLPREAPRKDETMTARIDPFAAAADMMKLLIEFGTRVAQAGLEPSLLELVKIRASQVNHCAVCLHMHTAAARKQGETEERLYMLDAWRESP